jgi:hypothetical protein
MERFLRSRVKSYEERGRFAAAHTASTTPSSEGPRPGARLSGDLMAADLLTERAAPAIDEPGITSSEATYVSLAAGLDRPSW